MTTAKEYAKMSDSEKKKEDWMNSKWRPMMGWSYMITCITDFVIFPILWSALQSVSQGHVNVQWQPITLQGAGLYHIAMGAILGIAAYGRTQEKLNGANNGGITSTFGQPMGQQFGQSFQPASSPSWFPSDSMGSRNSNTGSFGGYQPISQPTGQVALNSRGKPLPVQPDQPEI